MSVPLIIGATALGAAALGSIYLGFLILNPDKKYNSGGTRIKYNSRRSRRIKKF